MPRVLLYDGDCGFCARSAQALVRLGCEVETIPWQSWAPLASYQITEAEADEALHYVDGDRILIGHEAIAGALRRSRHAAVRLAGRALAAHAVRPVGNRAYAWVAANRYRLPGSSDACRLA